MNHSQLDTHNANETKWYPSMSHEKLCFIFAGKVWLGDSEVAWRAEQLKRISPLNPSTTATTITTTATTTPTTGGNAQTHPHLSPIAAPVTSPDLRSPTALRAKLGISPGKISRFFLLVWNKLFNFCRWQKSLLSFARFVEGDSLK